MSDGGMTLEGLAEMEADAARVAALLRANLDTLPILIALALGRERAAEPEA